MACATRSNSGGCRDTLRTNPERGLKASGVGVVVLSNSAQLASKTDRLGLTVLGKLYGKK